MCLRGMDHEKRIRLRKAMRRERAAYLASQAELAELRKALARAMRVLMPGVGGGLTCEVCRAHTVVTTDTRETARWHKGGCHVLWLLTEAAPPKVTPPTETRLVLQASDGPGLELRATERTADPFSAKEVYGPGATVPPTNDD